MKRTILRTDGTHENIEVGNSFHTWNHAIGASIGEIATTPDGELELWCDEEGLLTQREFNLAASTLAMRPIVGDVIVFEAGDIK
jgi:hypothetical protein